MVGWRCSATLRTRCCRIWAKALTAIEDGMVLATMLRGTEVAEVAEMLIRYQGLRHDHTARVQEGSRANGMRMDAGQAITIGQPGVHDYDVEAEARARR
jgi:salicylate hydroxylase